MIKKKVEIRGKIQHNGEGEAYSGKMHGLAMSGWQIDRERPYPRGWMRTWMTRSERAEFGGRAGRSCC